MIERMDIAIKRGQTLVGVMEDITRAKSDAATLVDSRTGQGFQSGVGFQRGSPGHQLGLGWPVPAGFPNDSFTMGVQTGEEVLVTPRGMSIEGLIFERLAGLLGGISGTPRQVRNKSVVNNFDMTVNTAATAATVTQDFRTMQALVGN